MKYGYARVSTDGQSIDAQVRVNGCQYPRKAGVMGLLAVPVAMLA